MNTRFAWKLNYQNEVEYEVYGHGYITKIEAYSDATAHGLLEYQRKTYNHDGPEDFDRIMVARQGGALIVNVSTPFNSATYWLDRRWTKEAYEEFVQHLKDTHADYLKDHEERRVKRGYTEAEYPIAEMQPIPRPIYYDPETRGYLTEPWFAPEPVKPTYEEWEKNRRYSILRYSYADRKTPAEIVESGLDHATARSKADNLQAVYRLNNPNKTSWVSDLYILKLENPWTPEVRK